MPPSFLALPPEIRLLVYYELLISRGHSQWDENRKIWTKNNLRVGESTGSSRVSILRWWPDARPPNPTIILTCRTIAREAIPILYGNNTFSFGSVSYDLGTMSKAHMEELWSSWFYGGPQASSNQLFHTMDIWAFLNIIGPTNAAMITSVSFGSWCYKHNGECMKVLFELMRLHFLCPRYLGIHGTERSIPPNHCRCSKGQAYMPLCTALKNFIDTTRSVRRFKDDGKADTCGNLYIKQATSMLKELDKRVAMRGEGGCARLMTDR